MCIVHGYVKKFECIVHAVCKICGVSSKKLSHIFDYLFIAKNNFITIETKSQSIKNTIGYHKQYIHLNNHYMLLHTPMKKFI